MTKEDIVRMARDAGLTEIVRKHDDGTVTLEVPHLPRVLMFATLVAAAERERIIAANAPEIERVNTYIKPLTDEELDALAIDEDGLPNSHIEFARAIERAHGIGGDA